MIATCANPSVALKLVSTPGTGCVVSAPPVLIASSNTIDYTCGSCGALLMHADQDQVHNLLIHCTECGSHNTTDA